MMNCGHIKKWPGISLLICVLMYAEYLPAQEIIFPDLRVKDNTLYITLDKHISKLALTRFTHKYNLKDIGLYQLISSGIKDSLDKNGWKTENGNSTMFLLSKKLGATDAFKNPSDKMFFYALPTPDSWRILGDNRVIFGTNDFNNNQPFTVKDGIVEFILHGYSEYDSIRLAGSFTNWQYGAFPMTKKGDHWSAKVKLEPGAYYYKFILDGHRWITDPGNNLIENDGRGNMNSVFFIPNKTFRLEGYPDAKKVFLTGSFNNWIKDQLPLQKTTGGWEIPMYLEHGTHRYQFIVDGRPVSVEKNERPAAEIGDAYLFNLKGFTDAARVAVAGNFNDWNPTELWMERVAGGWKLPYVLGPGNYQYKFIVDGRWITDPANLSVLDDGKGNLNSFLVIKANYRFTLKGYRNAEAVYLAGDFNDWQEKVSPMKKVDGVWVCDIYLGRGKHRYKFIVDGEWIRDPANKLWEENDDGADNSIVWIE